MVVKVRNIQIGDGKSLILIAGPCVVENRDMVMKTAERIKRLVTRLKVPFIFKASYKKANRSSASSFSTLGPEKALMILEEAGREFNLPLLTDIHTVEEATIAAEVVDVLQIPAFLCRQTELLQAAAKTGKAVNIKKGQFLAPADMALAAEKIRATGNKRILLTERGTTFGYNNLVVDMRSLAIMRKTGFPVILDVTHSVQLPGAARSGTGGQPEFIFPIARAGVAAGCDGLFLETHPNPRRALSDAESQLKLDLLEGLLQQVVSIDRTVKKFKV